MIYLTNENINELDLINSGYYGNIYLINNEAYKVFKDYLVETDKRIRFYNIIKKIKSLNLENTFVINKLLFKNEIKPSSFAGYTMPYYENVIDIKDIKTFPI